MARIHKEETASQKDFDAILTETTHEMPRYTRIFSQFIHLHGVASLSEIIGSTVARPNALLCGAIVSFVLTLGAYLLSKSFGYNLSGSESIAGFCIGWTAGILFDIFSPLFEKKR